MFSAILATALATSGGANQQFCHGGWWGCGGIHAGACVGTHYRASWAHSGAGYNSCYGYGCSGCHGGYGGYHATSCDQSGYSAYGPGGYWGAYSSGPPFVGSGFGSCGYQYYGGSPSGAYAPYGWHNGWRNYMDVGCFGCHGCYGTYNGWGCAHSAVAPVQGEVQQFQPHPAAPPAPAPEPLKKPAPLGSARQPDLKALVVIDVPEDAKLYIDGAAMKPGSGRRTFSTPELTPNKAYFYDIKIEVVQDGKPVTRTQRLVIRPGQEYVANFPDLANRPQVTQVNNTTPAAGQ